MYEEICENLTREARLVFFTGAGISTESGIRDFRSTDGLYSQGLYNGFLPEEILSRDFLRHRPEIFFRFYKERILHKNIMPNRGHLAIAGIESMGFQTTVITQNIDGLHSAAGSSDVNELHGSVHRNYCTGCKRTFGLEDFTELKGEVPLCDVCGSMVRPDIVLYGENLDERKLSKARKDIEEADYLFAVGSSLTVYPAAGLPRYFNGRLFHIINLGETPYDRIADMKHEVKTGTALGCLLTEIENVYK